LALSKKSAVGGVATDAARAIEQANRVIGVAAQFDRCPDEVSPQGTGLDLQPQLAEGDGVVLADEAILLVTQDLGQVGPLPWHEGGAGLARRDGEAAIVSRDIDLAQIAIGVCYGRDAVVAELLEHAVLQGAEHPFRSAA